MGPEMIQPVSLWSRLSEPIPDYTRVQGVRDELCTIRQNYPREEKSLALC